MRASKLIRLFITAFLFLLAHQLRAVTYYVNGTTGSDSNNGLSWVSARKTISYGLQAAKAGDQVWVAKGTYDTAFNTKLGVGLYGGFAGTETSVDQRSAFPRTSPDPLATIITYTSSQVDCVIVPSGAQADTRIDGFTVRNARYAILCPGNTYPTIVNNTVIDSSAGIYAPFDYPTVMNNTVISNGDGIMVKGGLVSGNRVQQNTGNGISATYAEIRNNIIAGNEGTGINCYDGCSPKIYCNVVTGNGGTGIICGSGGTPLIYNNTVSGNNYTWWSAGPYVAGIYCYGPATICNNLIAFNSSGIKYGSGSTVRRNCVYNPDGANYISCSAGTGDVQLDPKLVAVDYGQIHIQPGSPCIDAGDNSVVESGWLDIDGGVRNLDGNGDGSATVDIGADESDGTSWTFTPTVIRVSQSGNDANDGSSWSSAKRTVQSGVEAAGVVGGEVWVAKGLYPESVRMHAYTYAYGGFAGTETDKSTRNWSANRTIIQPSDPHQVPIFAFGGHKYSALDGFVIRGGVYDYSSMGVFNNIITGGFGLKIGNPGAKALVRGNVVAYNCTSGIAANGNVTIENNTVVYNRDSGLSFSSGATVRAVNNIFAFNANGVSASGGSFTGLNNCAYNPGGVNYSGATSTGITTDPKLAAPQFGNFHIQPGSPCIDAGSSTAGSSTPDIDAQIRPLDGNGDGTALVDIGADESDRTLWDTSPAVIRVSKTGSDSNEGSSWGSSMLTIQAALNAAAERAGQVWVARGTYAEHITLPAYVYLYGGFAGDELTLSARNSSANETVIDGSALAGYTILSKLGYCVSSVDGFKVFSGSSYTQDSGAVSCYGSSPIISNNRLTAKSGATAKAGISSWWFGSVKIDSNEISGFPCPGIYTTDTSCTITSNVIKDNAGTGIYCNSLSGSGCVITNNTIVNNRSTALDYAGGIYLYGPGVVSNNYVTRNFGDSGGGLSLNAGDSPCQVFDNVIAGNTANKGGGIAARSGTVTLTNNTIVSNVALKEDSGGVSVSSGSCTISNCIVAYNTSGICNSGGSLVLRNNCVYNLAGPNYTLCSAGSGDIQVDPKLSAIPWVQLHLLPGSPCIDAGYNAAAKSSWTDTDGGPRIIDGNSDGNPIVDIGADEYDGTSWTFSPQIVRVSASGNNANDGSSWGLAKRTIQSAIDSISTAGGEVWVAGGTFDQQVTLAPCVYLYGGFAGTESSRAERTLGTAVSAIGANSTLTAVTASYVGWLLSTVDGFTVSGASDGFRCDHASISVANSIIKSNKGYGIISSYGKLVATNNSVLLNGATGIYSSDGAVNLSGNKLIENGSGGVWCNKGQATVVGNVAYGNYKNSGGTGLAFSSCTSVTVNNNTLVNNFGSSTTTSTLDFNNSSGSAANNIVAFNSAGIFANSPLPTLSNNCVYNPGGTDYSGITAGSGDISVDPKVTSAKFGRLHLQPGSRCIDTGNGSVVQTGWLDIDGQSRVMDGNGDGIAVVDIGADESDGSTWPTDPVIVRVSPAGDDSADGSSWSAAKKSVTAAIAALSGVGGEIWAAQGTYTQTLVLWPGIDLYGGFAGDEASRDQRNSVANPTIIDAATKGCVLQANTGSTLTTIDGFTLRNGSNGNNGGGGIAAIGCALAITNNRIENCYGNGDGGGVYMYGCRGTISGNVVTGNNGYYGCGGIACSSSTVNVTGNTVTNNRSDRAGNTGISCLGGTYVVSGNTVSGNTAPTGSYALCCGGSVTIQNNVVTANSGSAGIGSSGTFTVKGNTASGNGGAGICANGTGTLANNSIYCNVSTGSGGGLSLYGGPMTVVDNVIRGNVATGVGGGVFCSGVTGILANNTVVGNCASDGGGVCTTGSACRLVNNIVALNSSGIYVSGAALPICGKNCVYNPDGYNYRGISAGTGDINADPCLEAPDFGRIHLQPGSPCIDAGDGSVVQTDWLDMDLQARVQDGNGDGTAVVDIGADESDGSSWDPSPTVLRVSPSGNDANDGSSWDKAKRTLQSAIDALTASGGEVWATSGVYSERIAPRTYVWVYGGFRGSETARAQRDWRHCTSTINAGSAGYGVTAKGVAAAASVDGFTIVNGSGISCTRSSLRIANNTITRNSGGMGAVYCSASAPTITNNAISNNTGIGIYIDASWPLVANNVLIGNTGSSTVSAIKCTTTARPFIVNNTLVGNGFASSAYAFAIEYEYSATPTIVNNLLAYNNGGIAQYGGSSTLRNNCAFGNGQNYWQLSPGTGDIQVDPKIASVSCAAVHLLTGSPCIDAGDSNSVGASSVDMDGRSRIVDGNRDGVASVDIGADEYDGTPWPSACNVVRVSPSGSDANDGSTWATAKQTIQSAIDAGAWGGAEVWAAEGTYNQPLRLGAYSYLYGGFSGNEASRSERDWTAHAVTIDAGRAASAVIANGTGKYGTIDGFNIRNGVAQGYSSSATGGGIQVTNSDLVISNTAISTCSAYYGGGIYLSGGNAVVSRNVISSNSANYGAGVYATSTSTGVSLVGNWISGNTATSYGGGILSSAAVVNNLIYGNSAYQGGGVQYTGGVLLSNTIANNTATLGGGIYSANVPFAYNNTLAFNSSGLFVGTRTGGGTGNNCYYHPAGSNFAGAAIAGTGDLLADPQFVSPSGSNYHLSPSSPCINRGIDVSATYPLLWPKLDIDGQRRVLGSAIDMGADEYWTALQTIADAKASTDGTPISLVGLVVTGIFGNDFYIEAADRSSGIRATLANHGLSIGTTVSVAGATYTSVDGERYIAASAVTPGDPASVSPVMLTNKALGGTDFAFDTSLNAGQRGVEDGEGLNNIGLLVCTTGRVTVVGTDFFYIDDGTHAVDAYGFVGVRVKCPGSAAPASGNYVSVTGMSSIMNVRGKYYRCLSPRSVTDIVGQ